MGVCIFYKALIILVMVFTKDFEFAGLHFFVNSDHLHHFGSTKVQKLLGENSP